MKVLKFGAIWCKECLVMRPMWEDIEKEIPELVTEYYDADESPDILDKYEAEKIPVFVFLDKDNNVILKLQGIQSKDELVKLIKENLDK